MKATYEDARTRYVCERCDTPIEIECESFYEFSGESDSNFWCPTCQDFPRAALVGASAASLPRELRLRDRFTLHIVPTAEPGDIRSYGLLYRPFTKRSFLRQYLDWLLMRSVDVQCRLSSSTSPAPKFDLASQSYSADFDYEIQDSCGSAPCHFLTHAKLKPESFTCPALDFLCNPKSEHGLCDTGDEAAILRHYIEFTGGAHYPMLIPQPALFTGRRRPDFLVFIPITRFQYRPVVVLIDRPGKNEDTVKAETDDYTRNGYIVRRLAVGGESHFKLARELKNWIENGAEHLSSPRGQ